MYNREHQQYGVFSSRRKDKHKILLVQLRDDFHHLSPYLFLFPSLFLYLVPDLMGQFHLQMAF